MTAERTFDATGDSVAGSRRFVAQEVADAPPAVREAVVLMVSELATNALVHAGGGFVVRVDRDGSAIRVTVTDDGPGTPVVRDPDEREPHGRGLRIVDQLADEWGSVRSDGRGTAVWFRIDTAAGSEGTGAPSRRTPSRHPGDGPPADPDGGGGRRLRAPFRVAR